MKDEFPTVGSGTDPTEFYKLSIRHPKSKLPELIKYVQGIIDGTACTDRFFPVSESDLSTSVESFLDRRGPL